MLPPRIIPLFFHEKVLLITGGTGSFGYGFFDYFIKNKDLLGLPHVVIYSRDETKQQQLQHYLTAQAPFFSVSFVIGDVRDISQLESCFLHYLPDYVIHAAAMKHVSSCEKNPVEAVKTNIFGSHIIRTLCEKYKTKCALHLSADKAVLSEGIYGATKHIAEKIFTTPSSLCRFVNLRYSNVLGSRGSVIEVFQKQLQKNQTLSVSTAAKRLFLSQEEVIMLAILALTDVSLHGTIIKKCPAIRIEDLASAMIELSGSGTCKKLSLHGEGEKDSALLFTEQEGKHLVPVDEKIYLIDFFSNTSITEPPYGTHNAYILTKDEIKEIIQKILNEQ
ncbi:MAG: polysaccharide biosynthesis protein [Nanoarchaeota archaeon]